MLCWWWVFKPILVIRLGPSWSISVSKDDPVHYALFTLLPELQISPTYMAEDKHGGKFPSVDKSPLTRGPWKN